MANTKLYRTAAYLLILLFLLSAGGIIVAAEVSTDLSEAGSQPELSEAQSAPSDESDSGESDSGESNSDESDIEPPDTSGSQEETVFVVPADGGTITVSDRYAQIGETVTVNAVPNEGYRLIVILRDDLACPASFTLDTAPTIVTAVFEKIPVESVPEESTPVTEDVSLAEGAHRITVVQVPNGTITVNKTTAVKGERVTITYTPDSGYEVSKYIVNDASISRSYFNMPDIDVVVTGEFKRAAATSTAGNEYKITVLQAENGVVTVSRATAQQGTKITVTVTPEDGYFLESISFNDVIITQSNVSYVFVMPSEDVTIEAVFTLSPDTGTSEISEAELSTESEAGLDASEASEDEISEVSSVFVSLGDVSDASAGGNAAYFIIPLAVIAAIVIMVVMRQRI